MRSKMYAVSLIFLPVFFILSWCVILMLLSIIGGWHELAGVYRSNKPFTGKKWYLQTAGMRWLTGYGNFIIIGVNGEGLYVSVLFFFRVGHPPLFIPWSDISAAGIKLFLFFDMYRLTFRKAPGIPFIISKGLGNKIKKRHPGFMQTGGLPSSPALTAH